MANIVQLKDKNQNKCYPVTVADHVMFTNGATLESMENGLHPTFYRGTLNTNTGLVAKDATKMNRLITDIIPRSDFNLIVTNDECDYYIAYYTGKTYTTFVKSVGWNGDSLYELEEYPYVAFLAKKKNETNFVSVTDIDFCIMQTNAITEKIVNPSIYGESVVAFSRGTADIITGSITKNNSLTTRLVSSMIAIGECNTVITTDEYEYYILYYTGSTYSTFVKSDGWHSELVYKLENYPYVAFLLRKKNDVEFESATDVDFSLIKENYFIEKTQEYSGYLIPCFRGFAVTTTGNIVKDASRINRLVCNITKKDNYNAVFASSDFEYYVLYYNGPAASDFVLSEGWVSGEPYILKDYPYVAFLLRKKNDTAILRESDCELSLIHIPALNDIDNSIKFEYSKYDIPVMYLYGDTTGMTKEDKKTLRYVYGDYTGKATVKWQGASSLVYPKKNYTVTFDTPRNINPKWGVHKKYVLKANWIDFSHLRNIVSAKLWGQCVAAREQEYFAITDNSGNNIVDTSNNYITGSDDPMLVTPNGGAVDGFPVLLLINNKFQGLYSLNIPKDGWMMGLDDLDNAAIISAEGGDYMATHFRELSEPVEDETDFALEYATDEDNTGWITTSLNVAIQKVIDNLSNANFYNAVNPYLDIPSTIDYMIFSAFTCNVDGIGRNYLLSTVNGTQWRFTAYDLDSTFGNEPYGKYYYNPETQLTMKDIRNSHNAFQMIYDNAPSMLCDRYDELRSTVFSDGAFMTTLYNYAAGIPALVREKDQELWPTVPSTETNNIEQIMAFYRVRAAALDKEMAALRSSI